VTTFVLEEGAAVVVGDSTAVVARLLAVLVVVEISLVTCALDTPELAAVETTVGVAVLEASVVLIAGTLVVDTAVFVTLLVVEEIEDTPEVTWDVVLLEVDDPEVVEEIEDEDDDEREVDDGAKLDLVSQPTLMYDNDQLTIYSLAKEEVSRSDSG
jgi:hypothetical protein